MIAAMPSERAERLLRYAVAFVWLATGALVIHPEYRRIGEAYLARIQLGSWIMVATCLGELALGGYLLLKPMSRPVAYLQLAAIGFFTLLLGVVEPMLLVHYLGVLTKNLPLLAMIWVSHDLARQGWTARSRRVLQLGMAVIWLTEGIFPKMLFQQSAEIEVIMALGWSASLSATMIWIVGLLQAATGVAALVLRGKALQVLLAAHVAALVFLPLLVTWVQPLQWVHPFGPLTKSVAIGVGTFVWMRECNPTST